MADVDANVYEVERIVARRAWKANKYQYLVKWVGYSEEENTWEDESNLTGCKEMIKEFIRGIESIDDTEENSKRRKLSDSKPRKSKGDNTASAVDKVSKNKMILTLRESPPIKIVGCLCHDNEYVYLCDYGNNQRSLAYSSVLVESGEPCLKLIVAYLESLIIINPAESKP